MLADCNVTPAPIVPELFLPFNASSIVSKSFCCETPTAVPRHDVEAPGRAQDHRTFAGSPPGDNQCMQSNRMACVDSLPR